MRVLNTEALLGGKFNIHICTKSESTSHTHNFFELVYVSSGSAVHTLDGEERVIEKGDYFFVDYGTGHSYARRGREKLEIINCLFVAEFIDRNLKNKYNFSEIVNNYMIRNNNAVINVSPANMFFKDDGGYIKELLNKCIDEYNEKESGYLEIIRSKLIEIIILTMRKNEGSRPLCTDELCRKIIDYTEENFLRKDILKAISEETFFSISYLSRKFKDNVGITFTEYLRKLRIEKSMSLLANTDKKIIEVAGLCGYSDMKSFNSVFKKMLGVTPQKFRQNFSK